MARLPAGVSVLCIVGVACVSIVLASGCGTLNYGGAEVIDARLEGPGTAAAALHVSARVAPEWLEVRVHNEGSDTVIVDWGRSWFVPADGQPHRVVSAEAVAEVESAALQRVWDRRGAHPQYQAAAQLVYRSWPGEEPRLLLQPWASQLAPGASRTVLLYPFEHVRVEPGAPVVIDPLFCTPPVAAAHHFALHIPLRARSGAELLTVALRTREAPR